MNPPDAYTRHERVVASIADELQSKLPQEVKSFGEAAQASRLTLGERGAVLDRISTGIRGIVDENNRGEGNPRIEKGDVEGVLKAGWKYALMGEPLRQHTTDDYHAYELNALEAKDLIGTIARRSKETGVSADELVHNILSRPAELNLAQGQMSADDYESTGSFFRASADNPFPSFKSHDENYDLGAVLAGTKPAAIIRDKDAASHEMLRRAAERGFAVEPLPGKDEYLAGRRENVDEVKPLIENYAPDTETDARIQMGLGYPNEYIEREMERRDFIRGLREERTKPDHVVSKLWERPDALGSKFSKSQALINELEGREDVIRDVRDQMGGKGVTADMFADLVESDPYFRNYIREQVGLEGGGGKRAAQSEENDDTVSERGWNFISNLGGRRFALKDAEGKDTHMLGFDVGRRQLERGGAKAESCSITGGEIVNLKDPDERAQFRNIRYSEADGEDKVDFDFALRGRQVHATITDGPEGLRYEHAMDGDTEAREHQIREAEDLKEAPAEK